MALCGERIAPRPHRMAVGVVRVLLTAAVVLVPSLQCVPGMREAVAVAAPAPHVLSVAGAPAAATHVGAADAATDRDHHRCALVTAAAVAAEAVGALHGWDLLSAAAVVAAATWGALWSHSTRGPPRRPSTWFLRGGRERLQHFCVMRR
ncbi:MULTISPECIES: hypothetical protein [Mycobacteriaceae]|uniref:Uncharacterized protein n=1 Tax=Mycobacteroides franklinii TaxID=948102 RepID=A0A4R5PE03_9MYCO|nr:MULTISPECIES: hypothetical protein [Mycobacteriaceae]TDH23608.1 hypothetical protein EJ571_04865 [Mycobacteroides franklinii]